MGIQRTSRQRGVGNPPYRHREATNGNLSEDSLYISSDQCESGGVSIAPGLKANDVGLSAAGDDNPINLSPRSSRPSFTSNSNSNPNGTASSARPGKLLSGSEGYEAPSTSDGVLEELSSVLAHRSSPPSGTAWSMPSDFSNIASAGASQANGGYSEQASAVGTRERKVITRRPNEGYGHNGRSTERTKIKTSHPRPGYYYAYVEDADDGQANSHPSLPVSQTGESGSYRDYRHNRESALYPPKSRKHDITPPLNSRDWDDWNTNSGTDASSEGDMSSDDESSVGERPQRYVPPVTRTPLSRSYNPSMPEDTNNTRSRLKRRINYPRSRPRRRSRESPTPQNRSHSFQPHYLNYRSTTPNVPGPNYGPPPPSYYYYDPQPGPSVPPYAPSVPGPSYEPPFLPYNTYDQYPGFDAPYEYPNYNQYQRDNYYYPTNTGYPQPPPPSWAYVPEPPEKPATLDPVATKVISKRKPVNTRRGIPAVEPASVYKPPVSSDPSGHDISFQISLKNSISVSNPKSVMLDSARNRKLLGDSEISGFGLDRGGKVCCTKIRSLEHYADRSGQDRITIVCPQIADACKPDGMRVLRWFHLQQNTLCLKDLREFIRRYRYLDEDLITIADRFLEDDCAKFEKKYSNRGHSSYYIEPGTVLRCDLMYEQEPSRSGKSILFCSVPYLDLGRHDVPENPGEERDVHLHPTRTLMESLYDYDLLNDRDSRQAILQCPPSEQNNILYIPQIWYLLCGSDILISYSQLPLSEIRGDAIQTRDESSRSLIALVTDLDNHQFSVALKTTDSFFSALERIEALRSNAGGNTIHDYDLILDNKEHLIAKNWLDIVARDPLPLLRITLKFRSKLDKKSLALTVRKPNDRFYGGFTADSSASDEDKLPLGPARRSLTAPSSGRRRKSTGKRSSTLPKSPTHAYNLTSYKGIVGSIQTDTKKSSRGDNTTLHSEHTDESNEPTLVGSLQSRQDNDRRRIHDLESCGIIINDISSVSNEPEIFSAGAKPVVWDYLVEDWATESRFSDPSGAKLKAISKDDSSPTLESGSSEAAKEHQSGVTKDQAGSTTLVRFPMCTLAILGSSM
ncbi:hypothetical protein SAMD00023353_2300320 [Rosellinia necatrix]|uniref:Uncharacterized protein n=1 Tax=Rosellinia necatrix TaxID=77044 RepID=A0A1S8A8W9_ROSNE|nr:hypothetical protein SAMD00023353_2300320 [Rosellinia necatrix]